ncbi:hypothetical protein B0H21DRAFT_723117 [Amylocystis lapponica]|nr:hypothetical protein B0H21DRAFT_723117 [Amylocystis lapponica]
MDPETANNSCDHCITDESSEQLPAYLEASLYGTTAVQNRRYEKDASISLQYLNVPAGLHSSIHLPVPVYLPPGWNSNVNPEGAPYYVNRSLADPLVVVTDVPLHIHELCDKVLLAVEQIQYVIKTSEYVLPSNCELYVHVDDATEDCGYYLIDHDCRTEFWLHDFDSDSLGLPAVASAAHLKFILQEHYWTHVEYFPHRPIEATARKELIDILRQARSDHLTSDNSTFPRNADQCSKLIELLDVQSTNSTYMTWATARVWTSVAQHRFQNYYGEDYARLDRGQRRLEQVPVRTSWAMNLCSFLSLGTPKTLENELDTLFLDGLVFINHWNKFVASLRQNWRETSLVSLGLLLTGACFLAFPANSALKFTGLAATFLSLFSLSCSLTLMQRYIDIPEPSAAMVAMHLLQLRHPAFGFGPIATVYSLPRALDFWSMLFLAMHIVIRATYGSGIALKVGVAVGVVFVCITSYGIASMLKAGPVHGSTSMV